MWGTAFVLRFSLDRTNEHNTLWTSRNHGLGDFMLLAVPSSLVQTICLQFSGITVNQKKKTASVGEMAYQIRVTNLKPDLTA